MKAAQEHRDTEGQVYLRVAEAVLRNAMSPLSVRELVERGVERGLFGDHGLSRTPEKSMQARISTDILERGKDSTIVRVAKGRFTLRERLKEVGVSEPDQPSNYREYIAEKRVLRTPSEDVLCIPERSYQSLLTFQGIDTSYGALLPPLMEQDNLVYVPRRLAEDNDGAKQFITYVIVQSGRRVLFFRRSYVTRAAEFLRGAKCIGFGGHVSAADNDIFSRSDRGLTACARRELSEELRLYPSDVPYDAKFRHEPSIERRTVDLFQSAPLETVGVLNDDSSEVGRRHVAVVFRLWIDDWTVAKRLRKGESSLKSLGWLDLSEGGVDLNEFEYWSQLCLRKFYPSNADPSRNYGLLRPNAFSDARVWVVGGRLGSGKSVTAQYLSQLSGFRLINSGEVLRNAMGSPPIREIGRQAFQERALKFIRQPGGPGILAEAILKGADGNRAVVDGIRHIDTLHELQARTNNSLASVFVQAPPDLSYERYRLREAEDELTFTYRDFLKLYDAPVESDLNSVGRAADAHIYNSFSLEELKRTVGHFFEQIAFEAQIPGNRAGSLSNR